MTPPGSSFCVDDAWGNEHWPGSPGTAAASATTNACPPRSRAPLVHDPEHQPTPGQISSGTGSKAKGVAPANTADQAIAITADFGRAEGLLGLFGADVRLTRKRD